MNFLQKQTEGTKKLNSGWEELVMGEEIAFKGAQGNFLGWFRSHLVIVLVDIWTRVFAHRNAQ